MHTWNKNSDDAINYYEMASKENPNNSHNSNDDDEMGRSLESKSDIPSKKKVYDEKLKKRLFLATEAAQVNKYIARVDVPW
jgi:hypothetical protein